MSSISVHMDGLASISVDVEPLDAIDDSQPFSLFIASIGYEQRGSFIGRQHLDLFPNVCAFEFHNLQVLSFSENRDFFNSVGRVETYVPEAFFAQLGQLLIGEYEAWRTSRRFARGNDEDNDHMTVAVDISCMTRQMIADCVLALHTFADTQVEVTWLYAPAAPVAEGTTEGPISVNRPIRRFEGWGDPDDGLTSIVCTGSEGDVALGVLDGLEPTDTWLFYPDGYSPAHDRRLRRSQKRLIESTSPDHRIPFRVDQPYVAFLALAGLVRQQLADNRVVILPMGPKIFALISLLVALSDRRKIIVWRVSANGERRASNRVATGDLVGVVTRSRT